MDKAALIDKAAPRAKPSWAVVLLVEFVASALLVFVFAAAYLYNLGVDGASSPYSEHRLPAFALAAFVGVSVWLMYTLFPRFSGTMLEANPFISAVVYGNNISSKMSFGWASLVFGVTILVQFLGDVLGVLAVWLLANRNIDEIHNYVTGSSGPGIPGGLELARVLTAETLGAVVLIVGGYFAIESSKIPAGGVDANGDQKFKFCTAAFAKFMALFYFIYMMIFWLHTRLTVDSLRGGAICMFAAFDEHDPAKQVACSPFWDGWSDATLYLMVFAIHAVVVIIYLGIRLIPKCMAR